MSLTNIREWVESRKRDAEVRNFQAIFGVFGETERRTFQHTASEVRVAGTEVSGRNDGSIQIKGHAAVFNKPSVEMRSNLGIFTEFIDKSAFDKVLRSNSDVLLDWDHDTRWPLARTGNGTLELTVDETGLKYWSRVAPTSYARDLQVLMEGGYLDQSSFLFRIAPGGEEWRVIEGPNGEDIVQRTIYEVSDLYDVCVCVAGAYPQTDSGIARTLAWEYAESAGFVSPRKYRSRGKDHKSDKETTWDTVAAEFRALGDVAWGPEEGIEDLMCDLECQINDQYSTYAFSVVDVALSLSKALVCDWDDYSFWVVPFTVGDDSEPTAAPMDEWLNVESAWVTTSEGYGRSIKTAMTRREARMADPTEVTPVVAEPEVQEEAPVDEAPAVEAEAAAAAEAAEAAAVAAEAEAEVARTAARESALAEARARIAAAREV